jgi:hypothetical protein
MEICGKSPDLKILRCDFMINDVPKRVDGCNNYILPNVVNYGVFGEYCLTFKANKTIKFINPESHIGGLKKIGFFFYMNTSFVEAKTLGIASLNVQLTPPGNIGFDLLLISIYFK